MKLKKGMRAILIDDDIAFNHMLNNNQDMHWKAVSKISGNVQVEVERILSTTDMIVFLHLRTKFNNIAA